MIRILYQKQRKEGKVYFILHFLVIHSPSLREVRHGTESRDHEEILPPAYQLTHRLMLSLSSTQLKPTCQRMVPSTVS